MFNDQIKNMKNVNVYVLAGDPFLHPYAQMIKKEAIKVIQIISKYIPITEVDIIIAHRPDNIGSGRISTQVKNEHLVNIAINVKNKYFNKFFHADLLEALAYVLYRTVRLQKNGYSKNLLDDCIDEGLAFNFQTEVTGDTLEPHFMSLKNIKTLRRVALRAKKEFQSTQYSHDDWFNGSKTRNIPQFTGYIIGYILVKHFLKINPHFTPSRLIKKEAKYFLAGMASLS